MLDDEALDYADGGDGNQNGSAANKADRNRVETGVDKDEESVRHNSSLSRIHLTYGDFQELHLQIAISASAASLSGRSGGTRSQSAAAGSTNKYAAPHIPTPDATGMVVDYEKLVKPRPFPESQTYIRFSDTVEDTLGIPYCMDEEDDEWLQSFNASNASSGAAVTASPDNRRSSSRKDKDKGKEPAQLEGELSEDDFELIMDHFERVTEERMPLLHLVRVSHYDINQY